MSGIADKFRKVAESLPETGSNCLAIINAQVDPDSIGGTLGLNYALRKLCGYKSDIFYCGPISHPQNRFLVNRYNLMTRMKPISELTDVDNRPVAFVDSHSINDRRLPNNFSLSEPLIVIDHHCERVPIKETENNFLLVDANVGSACTLIVELFKDLDLKVNDDEWGEKLATILALGIFEDTKGLVAAGNRDCSAYNYITDFCSRAELAELRKYKKPVPYYEHLKKALARMEKRGARLVTGIGGSIEYPDDVAMVADELLRMEGVTLVTVWVMVEDELRLSVRSDNPTFSLNEFINKRLGSGGGAKIAPDGHSEGGITIKFPGLGRLLVTEAKDKIFDAMQIYLVDVIFTEDG